MPGFALFRLATIVFHSVLGGMAVFILTYAAIVPHPAFLLMEGCRWGIMGWVLVYFQLKYLESNKR